MMLRLRTAELGVECVVRGTEGEDQECAVSRPWSVLRHPFHDRFCLYPKRVGWAKMLFDLAQDVCTSADQVFVRTQPHQQNVGGAHIGPRPFESRGSGEGAARRGDGVAGLFQLPDDPLKCPLPLTLLGLVRRRSAALAIRLLFQKENSGGGALAPGRSVSSEGSSSGSFRAFRTVESFPVGHSDLQQRHPFQA
ncbi:hypothetical protein [Streptomyces sp. YU58]|uniref:hypothetical protein n=1 Tax=Streptomyces sp. SX92 TaxID=3158972 RepID=UPI0027B8EB12|nr:hypothetical protein [Streptomyces coralus]WLW57369.1 hypothetical protein QU709_41040 [Streptomyces coralus]